VTKYARENKIPFLGICLGMQLAVVEFCRNVLGITDAASKELEPETYHDVITTMEDTSYVVLGGTLRLGSKTCVIEDENSLAYKVYGSHEIKERHRHRYEVNPKFIKCIEAKGMIFSGKDSQSERMEILELKDHPFFFGSQFHPEYKTHPFKPPPSFFMFVLSAKKDYQRIEEFIKDRKTLKEQLEDIDDIENLVSVDKKYQKLIDVVGHNSTLINDRLRNFKVKETLENLTHSISNFSHEYIVK
jgi:CTP synthase (UTP-ammonia lyase)